MSFLLENKKSIFIVAGICLALFGSAIIAETAQGEALENGRFCIAATNSDDSSITSTKGKCEEGPEGNWEETPETPEAPKPTILFIERADSSLNVPEHAGKEAHITVTRHIEGVEDEIVCERTQNISTRGYLNALCVPSNNIPDDEVASYYPSYTIKWTLETGEEWNIEVTPEQVNRFVSSNGKRIEYKSVWSITAEGVTQIS